MTRPTRSVYAIDPKTQKVRLVVQVTPDGWSEDGLEEMFGGLIPVLGNGNIPIAVIVSKDTAFLVRFEEKGKHFDIDEVEVAQVVAPHEVDPDPTKLYDTVFGWLNELANHDEAFARRTALVKRVPELIPLVVGAELRERDGSIGIPTDHLATVGVND